MHRRTVLTGLPAAAVTTAGFPQTGTARTAEGPRQKGRAEEVIERLAITVPPAANRGFSFTDKQDSYFHGRTHTDANRDWFAGWNIATRRIFQDYQVWLDGKPLSRASAQVRVWPDRLERVWPELTETLELVEQGHALLLSFKAQGKIEVILSGSLTPLALQREHEALFTPREWQEAVVVQVQKGQQVVVACAPDLEQARARAARALDRQQAHRTARRQRMARLVAGPTRCQTADPNTNKALDWLTLTLDQLDMNQQGPGIYAGLPWFNDYWGRDSFISFAGAVLVSGQFDRATAILQTFADLQDRDPDSPDFGRVPNRARPDGIIYNSVDGTPRFVIAVMDLIRYSGRTALAQAFWPAIERATRGALTKSVDASGYLTHDDADTWMDAKEGGVRAWSPRGNRANDVQALWYQQLQAAARIADLCGHNAQAKDWRERAARLKPQFARDFTLADGSGFADHLNADGSQDLKLRPNQLYALDMVDDEALQRRATRRVWEGLVYPWGVASLSQDDPDFHPYHEHWHYYHKDAAYHNGAVWLWNNGMAMQKLLAFDQIEPAFALFSAMNHQALVRGAVGSLAENADALPKPGQVWATPTGTFLQAWSNAEHLRVWYQHFVGLRPDLDAGLLVFAPRVPDTLLPISINQRLGEGWVRLRFRRDGGWQLTLVGLSLRVRVDLVGHACVDLACADGQTLSSSDPRIVPETDMSRAQANAAAFAGLRFCQPVLRPGLKSLSRYHDPPIQP